MPRLIHWVSARLPRGFVVSLALLICAPVWGGQSPWSDVTEADVLAQIGASERLIVPQAYRAVGLDLPALKAQLELAPIEGSPDALNRTVRLTLPLPGGASASFRVEESPIMLPELAIRLPGVKTYHGFGVDDPSSYVRFDVTPTGFHALIRSSESTVYIDPYARNVTAYYIVYDKRDFLRPEAERPVCLVGTEQDQAPHKVPSAAERSTRRSQAKVLNGTSNGGTFKQLRLAVAATGEYTSFHGGTVPGAKAAIVTTINRVNVVYRQDLAIQMNLVDNSAVVYTNGATDPYTNSCSSAELAANQTTLDTFIGASNYDLGHVFGGPGGGGGLAGAGPCLGNFNNHARGCTGSNTPAGDPFDIDFVAHEIGHQWSAPHTFNGTAGSCFGNRESSDAYEPGSGSTIMAYAGICTSDNIQTNSDDYFHGSSLETIAGYDPLIYGGTACLQTSASGNSPPSADAGVDRTVPKNTPFLLCGSASDPDGGDVLTYLWEEYTPGVDPGGPPNDASNGPFFRSFKPTSNNCRSFPKASDTANDMQTNGEIMPNVAANLTFRLSVFDNHPGSVGGGFDQDDMALTVDATTGPFRVTSQNASMSWAAGSMQTVTWNVAGTSGAPINCANVDIAFSSDGGQTFATPLLSNTPNDGSQTITAPGGVSTATGRIRVKCSDNIFFDVNNADIIINALSQCRTPALALSDPGDVMDTMYVIGGDLLNDLNVSLDIAHTWVGDLTVSLLHVPSSTSVILIDRPGFPSDSNGCASDNIVTELDDEASLPVENQCLSPPPAISGSLTPNNPLNGFDGKNASGDWRLTVNDAIPADSGILNSWCLKGAYVVAPGCPATLSLSSQIVSGTQTFAAQNSIMTGPSFNVASGADVTFRIGSQPGNYVRLGPGTDIDGAFKVQLVTSPCP